jgi:hypothetical protein
LRFLLVSVLGHLLAFLLFQIVTDEKVTAPGRERELQMLSHDLPEHQALLHAVESEVPLAALSHQLLPVDDLLARSYRSAFAASHVAPKEPPRWKPREGTTVPIFPPAQSDPPASPAAHALFPGQLVLAPALAARLRTPPEIPCVPRGKSLESPSFLVAIESSGGVQFVFLEKSSGDADADALAEKILRQAVFDSGGPPATWGLASLVWRATP